MSFTVAHAYRPKRRASPEADFQTRLVEVLRARLKDALVFHIPNGINMPIASAMKLRRMGLLAGVPDLGILHAKGKILFLECKSADGVDTTSQKNLFPVIRALGHRIEIVRNIAEALQYCDEAGIQFAESNVVDARTLFKQESLGVRRRPA